MFVEMPLCTKALSASLLVDSPLSLRRKERQIDTGDTESKEGEILKIRVKAIKDLET